MKKRLFLALFLKTLLVIFSLFFATAGIAATRAYKGENVSPLPTTNEKVTIPARKYYKGEIDSNAYASSMATGEGKYSGKVFNSDLYQGELAGPDYSPANCRSLHDGFYVGAEMGYDAYSIRHSINIIQNGSSVFQQNPVLSASGLSYSLVGGFGRYFDEPLYVGAEVFYNYSQANTSQNVGLYQGATGIYYVKSEILGSYGLSFLPGIKLSNTTLLYLKGGYSRVDLKTYETSVALNVNNAQSNGVNGWHVGLGLEANVYQNWSIRGEYTHANYENFQTRVGTTVTPSDNQFMVGVLLHWF